MVSLEHPLEAICDPRVGLADDLAQRFAFRSSFTDLADLLRDTSVQALIISRDAPNLVDIIDTLLGSGLPFWVDAGTVGLEKLIARLKRRSKNCPIYMISHPHRFAPAFVRAAELIRSGRIAEPVLGSLEICSVKADGPQRELPLEHLLEGALDLLCYLLGSANKVYASWDGASMLAGIVKFGATAVVLQLRRGTWAGQACHQLKLYGRQGQELSVENITNMTAREGESLLARSVQHPLTEGVQLCAQHGWTGSLVSFLLAVSRAQPGASDLTNLIETRKLAQAVIRSASSGREVSLRT
jgi:predicted dehydrogenase